VTSYWCERALVDGAVAGRVSIDVADGRIAAITPDSQPAPGATRLSGLVVPGFANAHSHAFHRALRGRTQRGSGSFWTWRELMYDVAGRLDPDRYHRLARAVFAEMVSAGFSAVGEFHYLHHQADGTPYDDPNAMGEALLAAAVEAGIRITLLDTLYLHGGLGSSGYEPVSGPQVRYRDRDVAAWASRVSAIPTAAGARIGAALHSVRAVDPAGAREVGAWTAERDSVLHVHLSEQPEENEACLAAHGVTPTQLLADAGVLTPRTTVVHATHLTDTDIAELGTARVAACICPTTERDLADGIGPTAQLAARGARLCVGTDSHAVIDPFEEARAIELDERLRSGRRGTHTAADLLDAVTVHGHRSLGWHDAGLLEVGARADLVSVRLDSVRTAGATDDVAVETLVFAATSADVTDVVVDGRHLVVDGRHATIDVAAELTAAIAAVVSP
jgi:formiminoglutamate deiminase